MHLDKPAQIAAAAALALAVLMPPPARAMQALDNGSNRALAQSYNASGLALFKRLAARPGNVVLSPYSIGSAMAMVLSGARGATESEMASVLRQHLARPDMEAAQAELQATLNGYDKSAAPPICSAGMTANGGRCEAPLPANGRCPYFASREDALCVSTGRLPQSARLLTANALMLPPRLGDLISADYATLLWDKYQAEVFRNAGLDEINGWVGRKTEGKIDRILDQLDPTSPAVVLNAIYFNAKWASPFTKSATKDDTFNLSRQQQVAVPMMRHADRYAFAARAGYRAIRMPYSVAPLGMVIVLPDEIDGLDAVTSRFDDNEWAALAAALHAPNAARTVDLELPRFKTSLDTELVPQFRAAGMTRAFDLKLADFSGMSRQRWSQVRIAIGSIRHRATIDVMEDGTEAAAATAVIAIAAMAAPVKQPPVQIEPFHVDHPFLFAILDDATGAVLFEGRIADPR
jgi:serpin B